MISSEAEEMSHMIPHENDPIDQEILQKGKDVIKDFDDTQEVFVDSKRQESKLISIRLPVSMIKNLRIVAQVKGDIGYQQILKTYIAEGLMRDSLEIFDKAKFNVSLPIFLSESSSLNEKFPHESWVSGEFPVMN